MPGLQGRRRAGTTHRGVGRASDVPAWYPHGVLRSSASRLTRRGLPDPTLDSLHALAPRCVARVGSSPLLGGGLRWSPSLRARHIPFVTARSTSDDPSRQRHHTTRRQRQKVR